MAGPVQCHVGAIDVQKLILNGKRNDTHLEIVNKKTKKNMKGLQKNEKIKSYPMWWERSFIQLVNCRPILKLKSIEKEHYLLIYDFK